MYLIKVPYNRKVYRRYKKKYNYSSVRADPDKDLNSYFKGIKKIYNNNYLSDRQRSIALRNYDKKFTAHNVISRANLDNYRYLNRNDYATSSDYWLENHNKTKDNWYNDHTKNSNKWLKDYSFKNMIENY